MRPEISSVAFEVWVASCLTSDATTAKPLPASPARAASIVALSAKRLVCSAIAWMSWTTLPMSAEAAERVRTIALASRICATASWEIFEDCCTCAPISLIAPSSWPAASPTVETCSAAEWLTPEAAPASRCASAETAVIDRAVPTSACAAAPTESATALTCRSSECATSARKRCRSASLARFASASWRISSCMRLRTASRNSTMARAIAPNSSCRCDPSTAASTSPSASRRSEPESRLRGPPRAGSPVGRPADRPRHHDARAEQHEGDAEEPQPDVADHHPVGRAHVLDPYAAADQPLPGSETGDVGDLRHPLRGLRQLEQIVDVAAALLGHLDELADEVLAGRVVLVDAVGADPFRLDRVDEVDPLVVVDEHVLLAAVTDRADRALGLGLRLLAGD